MSDTPLGEEAGQVTRLAMITLHRDRFRLNAILDKAALLRAIGSAVVVA